MNKGQLARLQKLECRSLRPLRLAAAVLRFRDHGVRPSSIRLSDVVRRIDRAIDVAATAVMHTEECGCDMCVTWREDQAAARARHQKNTDEKNAEQRLDDPQMGRVSVEADDTGAEGALDSVDESRFQAKARPDRKNGVRVGKLIRG